MIVINHLIIVSSPCNLQRGLISSRMFTFHVIWKKFGNMSICDDHWSPTSRTIMLHVICEKFGRTFFPWMTVTYIRNVSIPCYLTIWAYASHVKLANGEEHILVGSLDMNQGLQVVGRDYWEIFSKGIILQLRQAFKRNDEHVLLATTKFVAHRVKSTSSTQCYWLL